MFTKYSNRSIALLPSLVQTNVLSCTTWVSIGHYGVLSKTNPIVERLIEGGWLDLISNSATGTTAVPKKAAAPKKKTAVAESGYNPDAKDGDGDGLVQDGTKWEREAK